MHLHFSKDENIEFKTSLLTMMGMHKKMTAAVLDMSIRKFSNSSLRKNDKKRQTVREYSVHFFGWEAGSICVVINFTKILKAMKKYKSKMLAQKSYFLVQMC